MRINSTYQHRGSHMLSSTTLKAIRAFSRLCDGSWLKLVRCKMIKCRPSPCGVCYCRWEGSIPDRSGENTDAAGWVTGLRSPDSAVPSGVGWPTPDGKKRKSLIEPQTFCFLLWIICMSAGVPLGHSQRTILILMNRRVVFPQLLLVLVS